MSSAAKNARVPVKIVVINTQYIETDANSFKSVVQNLTGKNSVVAVEATAAPPPPVATSYGGNSTSNWEDQTGGAIFNTSTQSLGRGKSFNDFDKLLKDLPPLDELLRLYADEIRY